MDLNRSTLKYRPLVLFLCISPSAFALTHITSVPFECDKSGETYVLANDITIAPDATIRVSAPDVVIDGTEATISIGSDDVVLKAIFCTGANTEIRNCTFRISRGARLTLVEHTASGGTVHHCTVYASGLYHGSSGYPRLFVPTRSCTYYQNTFVIDSTCKYVNVIVGFGDNVDDVRVYRNTFEYASTHGRPILMDSGADNWRVENNKLTIKSRNTGDSTTYAIMCRNGNVHIGGSPSTHHSIVNNVIDARASSRTMGIVLSSNSEDILIQNNTVSAPYYPIRFTDISESIQIHCNILDNNEDGDVISMYGSSHKNVIFMNNEITGGEQLMRIYEDLPGEGEIKMCGNVGLTDLSAIQAASSADIEFSSSSCQTLEDNYSERGADLSILGRQGSTNPPYLDWVRSHAGIHFVKKPESLGCYTLRGRRVTSGSRFTLPGILLLHKARESTVLPVIQF
ncbi:MAG: hypothetical protein GF344_04520 [Chitinivibrionales bacterium]|nr:hypothetical protein [Chitinivibrionales bacterium]